MKYPVRPYILLVAVAAVLFVSCQSSPARPVPTASGPTWTPTAIIPATVTATAAPTATPRLPVAIGTALPAPTAVLSTDNGARIVELARWGKGVIQAISYSPDGGKIALASASGISVINAHSLKEVDSLESASPAHSVAFSSDGTLLAAGLEDGTVALWEAASGHPIRTLSGSAKPIRSVSFSPDGHLLAAGSDDGSVMLWQILDGTVQGIIHSHSQGIIAVVFSPDGHSLFSGSLDASVHQVQLPDGKLLHVFGGYASAGVSLSTDGAVLAAAGSDSYSAQKGKVSVWSVADGKLVRTVDAPYVTGVALSPDGRLVATADAYHTASIWNISSGESETTLTDLKPAGEVPRGPFQVAFSPAGDALALGGLDVVGLWAVQDHTFLGSAKTHSFPIYGIALSPDGKLLASVGYVEVQLRKLDDGELVPLDKTVTGFADVAFAPDGSSLALGGQDGKARIWPLDDLAHPRVFDALSGDKIRAIAFSPDGQTFAFSPAAYQNLNVGTNYTGEIQLHNVSDGTLRKTLTGSALWYITNLGYSPSGDLLASAAPGDRIMVFRTSDDGRLYTFRSGISFAFSPDGSRLAGSSTDKSIHVWEMASGKEVLTIRGLPEFVWPVAYSPDGKLLAGGDEKGTIYLWNAADGSLAKSWAGHSTYVNDLLFTADGTRLITASGDGTIRFWGLKP